MARSFRSRDSGSPPRSSRKLSNQINNIRKRSQKSIKKTIAVFSFSRHQNIISNLTTFSRMRSQRSRTRSIPLSRSRSIPLTSCSFKSYRSIGAYNRISFCSTEQANQTDYPSSPIKRYSLHNPDNEPVLATIPSSASSITEPECEDRIADVDNDMPCAAEFQTASEMHEMLPTLKVFAAPTQQLLPAESWTDFLGRVFQPYACTLSRSRLSQTELLSPILSDESSTVSGASFESAKECQDESLVEVAQYGRIVKGATLEWIHQVSGKTVSEPAPNTDLIADIFSLVQPARDSMFDKPVRPLSIIKSSSAPELTTPRTALKHNSLPYIPLGERFDPFKEFSTFSARSSITAEMLLEYLPTTTYVPPQSAVDLHLGPICQTTTNSSSPIPSDSNSSSWLDLSDNEEVITPVQKLAVKTVTRPQTSKLAQRPRLTHDRTTGVVTRKITNARNSVPNRVVMIDHYPLFTSDRKTSTTVPTTKAPASPVIATAKAVVLTKVKAPAHVRTVSAPVELPARPVLSRDRSSGVLTRRITGAHPSACRVVMVDNGYPLFKPERSAPAIPRPSTPATPAAAPKAVKAPRSRKLNVSSAFEAYAAAKPSPLRQSFIATDGESVLSQNDEALAALEGKLEEVLTVSKEKQEMLMKEMHAICDFLGI